MNVPFGEEGFANCDQVHVENRNSDGLGSPIGAVAAVLFGAGRSYKNPTTILLIENLQ